MLKTVLFAITAVIICEAGPFYTSYQSRDIGRIVGGSQTTIAKHPYQLSLQINGIPYCGASIIGPRWALTAAHCIQAEAKQISLRAGSTSQYNGGTVHQAVKAVVHKQFNNKSLDYDIAVIQINTSFPIGSGRVDKINLAESGFVVPDNSSVVVSGWGTLTAGGSTPEYLHEVSVNIINRKQCQTSYINENITTRMICAGIAKGGKDSCQGDSGGPLIYKNNTQVGVVSWGYGCGSSQYPGVYTNVENLRQWIRNNTGI